MNQLQGAEEEDGQFERLWGRARVEQRQKAAGSVPGELVILARRIRTGILASPYIYTTNTGVFGGC